MLLELAGLADALASALSAAGLLAVCRVTTAMSCGSSRALTAVLTATPSKLHAYGVGDAEDMQRGDLTHGQVHDGHEDSLPQDGRRDTCLQIQTPAVTGGPSTPGSRAGGVSCSSRWYLSRTTPVGPLASRPSIAACRRELRSRLRRRLGVAEPARWPTSPRARTFRRHNNLIPCAGDGTSADNTVVAAGAAVRGNRWS